MGYTMPLAGTKNCMIFDNNAYDMSEITDDVKVHVEKFCGVSEGIVLFIHYFLRNDSFFKIEDLIDIISHIIELDL